MHKPAMKAAAVLLPMLLVVTGAQAKPCAKVTYHAPGDFEGEIDQDGARAAVKRGDAAPFQNILQKVQPRIHGEIVGQKLEQHRGIWVYEFRVVDANGHMQYMHFGARSGAPVEVRPLPCASS
jgi:uncharacterized membrane protein YkoI